MKGKSERLLDFVLFHKVSFCPFLIKLLLKLYKFTAPARPLLQTGAIISFTASVSHTRSSLLRLEDIVARKP